MEFYRLYDTDLYLFDAYWAFNSPRNRRECETCGAIFSEPIGPIHHLKEKQKESRLLSASQMAYCKPSIPKCTAARK